MSEPTAYIVSVSGERLRQEKEQVKVQRKERRGEIYDLIDISEWSRDQLGMPSSTATRW